MLLMSFWICQVKNNIKRCVSLREDFSFLVSTVYFTASLFVAFVCNCILFIQVCRFCIFCWFNICWDYFFLPMCIFMFNNKNKASMNLLYCNNSYWQIDGNFWIKFGIPFFYPSFLINLLYMDNYLIFTLIYLLFTIYCRYNFAELYNQGTISL